MAVRFREFSILVLFLCIDVACLSQAKFNGDFEISHSPNFFRNWGRSDHYKAYVSSVDEVIFFSGRKSLSIYCRDKNVPVNASLFFYNADSIPSALFRNKHIVKISAHVKADSLSARSYATLYANIRGGGKFDYKQSDRISSKSAPGWHRLTVTLPVPDLYTSVTFGGIAEGVGQYWFDNFEVIIDGHTVEDISSLLPPLSPSQVQWTNKHLIPIKRNDDAFQINKQFYKSISTVKVLGLGEATHGTHEFSLMKHEIIKEVAKRSDQNIIVAFESGFGAALRINDYIRDGKGDLNHIVRYISNPWRTKEFIELIEWIRNFNDTHTNKILFLGFDMQGPNNEIENLALFAATHEMQMSKLIEEIKRIGNGVERYITDRGIGSKIDSLSAALKRVEEYFSSKSNPLDDHEKIARHNLEVIHQFLARLRVARNRAVFRDSCMAENVFWMSENFPEHKIVLWAHNEHVKKSNRRTGSFLKNRFGESYSAVGFATFAGSFSAFDQPHDPKSISLESPHPETYEYWFDKLRHDDWIINLSNIERTSRLNWMKNLMWTRSIGAFEPSVTQFNPTYILDDFDYLMFIKDSKHITYVNPWAQN